MKTGVYINPSNEPIIKRIMAEHTFTSVSAAINYIIEDYDKIKNGGAVANNSESQENKPDFSSWFVEGENSNWLR